MEEKRVIATVKKVMPAVVSIVISKRLEDLEREMPEGHYPATGKTSTRNMSARKR
jgi:hypothetical protein